MTIAFIIRDATDTPRTATGWLVRNASNVQKTASAAYDRTTSNVSELFYNPSGSATLAVVATPDQVEGSSLGSGTATTDTTTAAASGGTAPYTYAWTLDNYTGGVAPSANAPANATTDFTLTGMDPGGIYGAQFTVTATDDNGATATDTVQCFFADNG